MATRYRDVYDSDKEKLLRARYIGAVDTARHAWLVYGVMDTAGVVVKVAASGRRGAGYAAYRSGRHAGRRRRIEDAICLLLCDRQRRIFLGQAEHPRRRKSNAVRRARDEVRGHRA